MNYFSEMNKHRMRESENKERRRQQKVREKDLQRAVEELLEYMGYKRRTAKQIAAGKPRKGWYTHIHRAQGNPIFLDLLLLGNDGRYLEIELKIKGGRIAAWQRQLMDYRGFIAYSVDEVKSIVETWETSNDKPVST